MHVWSRGLGRVELAIDLKKAKVVWNGTRLFITGKTEPPVSWDFVMSVDSAEFWRLARVVLNKNGMKLVSKYFELQGLKRGDFKKRYAEAIKTRTGVKPELEYSFLLTQAKTEKRQESAPRATQEGTTK